MRPRNKNTIDFQQLERAVTASVADHGLLDGVARLGLAVSGGADSVALLRLMHPLCRERGIAVTVLHLNHGLREAADEETRFVQALATDAKLPCLFHRVNLSERAADGRSLEMAARDARLDFFRHCTQEAELDAIATGHQADDVAETLLLRLVRGAGTAGLAGLRPRSNPGGYTLIRPLLDIPGADLRAWLTERGFAWREDASNHDAAIPRNFVRHTLLPQLEQAWGMGLRARLCQSAETLREDDALLDTLAEERLAAMSATAANSGHPDALPISDLLPQPIALQRRVVRMWLFRQDQSRATGLDHVRTLLARCRELGDWRLTLPDGMIARVRSGWLNICAANDERAAVPSPADLPLSTAQPLRWGNLAITATPDKGIFSTSNGIGHYPAVCTLGADAIRGLTLTVRTRQTGDRIAPTGLTGSKKIQDIFVDAKIPEPLRDTIPLLVCDGEVAWLPGYRVARRFAVPSPDAPSIRVTIIG